ncbi:MAG: NAD(+)/NADH kinase [Candidatus Amulumruptor caecigallinarius]|nr:NAD(+)/NADH kinase [Candidatus Amulumruptor caecigallinarius]MCM1397401.1 NAD(+)/NADH kinase [Candidatus Amulumruptor caecigallinarius]MCM1454486.1 NAD(+)/NADH kinase [bacterium]
MKIAIYGNRRQQPYLELITRLLSALHAHGAELTIHAKLHDYLTGELGRLHVPCLRADGRMAPDTELVISIGGDGTFLNTARWVGELQTPILGVNTGHLGYLAACSISESIAHVPAIVAGRYAIEDRSMLCVRTGACHITWPYALNEVAILKKDTSSMLRITTAVNGLELAEYRADGLIISTPTGSSGYNLSVGGPILQPSTPALVIAPIAPHSLSMRPVVLDDRSTIATVTDTRADSFLLALDGHSTIMPVGSAVTIHRAPFVTRVVHIDPNYSFVDTLRSKLHWGA